MLYFIYYGAYLTSVVVQAKWVYAEKHIWNTSDGRKKPKSSALAWL